MKNTYRGPWQDTPAAALSDALYDVNVSPGDYVECTYSDEAIKLEPIAADRPAISVQFVWSEPRQMTKAVLTRVPCTPLEDVA